jgi:hypothetical protein
MEGLQGLGQPHQQQRRLWVLVEEKTTGGQDHGRTVVSPHAIDGQSGHGLK